MVKCDFPHRLLPPALSEPTHHRFRDPHIRRCFRCSAATIFLSKALSSFNKRLLKEKWFRKRNLSLAV